MGAPVATLEVNADALDVSFPVEAGPRVDLGPIAISGETRLHESYIRRRLLLAQGQVFDPVAIEKARQDLAAVPAIASVRIRPAEALDAAGQLPVQVEVAERPLRVVDLGAAYSTDQGGSVSASWTHRDLFGNAEVLALGVAATQLGGTAATQPGYNATAVLTLPDWWQCAQTLSFNLQAVREYLQAYDLYGGDRRGHAGAQAGRTISRCRRRAAVRTGLYPAGRRGPQLFADAGAAGRAGRQHA